MFDRLRGTVRVILVLAALVAAGPVVFAAGPGEPVAATVPCHGEAGHADHDPGDTDHLPGVVPGCCLATCLLCAPIVAGHVESPVPPVTRFERRDVPHPEGARPATPTRPPPA